MTPSRLSFFSAPSDAPASGRLAKSLVAVASSLALVVLSACGGSDDEPPGPAPDTTLATTASGPVQGVKTDDVVSFKGIPFAAPPVGNLRWRAPQPVTPWTTVRQATTFGSDCTQATNSTPPSTVGSEDCLYVNVWRPAAAGAAAPVMVWIYGGGYISGSSTVDGTQFAKQGVVLVSLNYRLGRFGFFGHPALSATAAQTGEPLGNYGYMDQIAALRWVKQNIAAFGGDPNNVTVFGESAGGESIHNLLTTPVTAGLFQKAINQSGNGRVNQAFGRYLKPTPNSALPSAEEQGVTFAQQFGITGTDAAALTALRALTPAQVTDNLTFGDMSAPHGVATFSGGSIIDGQIVLAEPQVRYNAGQFHHVPMMLGTNDADLGFPKPATTKDQAFAIFGPSNLTAARAAFDPQGTATVNQVRTQIAAVVTMHEPARFVARVFAEQNVPAYLYRFSYVPDSLRAFLPGAVHGLEIPFAFNTVDGAFGPGTTSRDRQVGNTVQAYWVAFAKTGRPAPTGLTTWAAFNRTGGNLLEFTSGGGVQAWPSDPLTPQLDLVQPLNEQNLTVNWQYGL